MLVVACTIRYRTRTYCYPENVRVRGLLQRTWLRMSSCVSSEDATLGHLVLPLEATCGLELMDVCVAWVQPQQVSKLVRTLTEAVQHPQLSHLKRVHQRAVPPEGELTAPGTSGKLAVLLWAGDQEVLEQLPDKARASLQ